MRVLLTNDDGAEAEGIGALRAANPGNTPLSLPSLS